MLDTVRGAFNMRDALARRLQEAHEKYCDERREQTEEQIEKNRAEAVRRFDRLEALVQKIAIGVILILLSVIGSIIMTVIEVVVKVPVH